MKPLMKKKQNNETEVTFKTIIQEKHLETKEYLNLCI